MRGAFRLIFPGGAILAAALLAMWWLGDSTLDLVTGRYGIVLYAAGALLAAFFHRSRVVLALAGLAGLELLSNGVLPDPERFVPLATVLVGLLGLFSVVRDRGVVSRGGLLQLALTAGLAYGGYLAFGDAERLAAFGALQLLPVGLPGRATDVPQGTIVVGMLALALSVYAAYRWRGPVERALLWSEVLILTAVLAPVGGEGASLLLMAAGLVLSVSVLETSYSMAYRDELTGLPARRALVHDLSQISGTFTIAMVDVDHFKQFNDKHGHDVGDQVLQLVATRLAAAGGGAKAYRYGGEEFTLLYPGRVRDDALPHAEAVRKSVEEASFSLRAWNRPRKKPTDKKSKKAKKRKRPKKLSVTVSIGLADSTGKDPDPAAVLKKADKALYRAKQEGRNRVGK